MEVSDDTEETQEIQRQKMAFKDARQWKTMQRVPQQKYSRTKTEATETRDNMGISENVRDGDKQSTITSAEM